MARWYWRIAAIGSILWCGFCPSAAYAADSENYQMEWQVLDAGGHSGIDVGGDQRRSENFVVQDSLGQPVCQENELSPSSETYQSESGHWSQSELVEADLGGGRWHMISLPVHPLNPDPAVVFSELLGPPDLLSGSLHRYDPVAQAYKTYWAHSPSEFGEAKRGEGYWLYLHDPLHLRYEGWHSPVEGDRACNWYEIPNRWYLTGPPSLAETTFGDGDEWFHDGAGPSSLCQIGNVWVQDPLIYWDGALGSYVSSGCLWTDEDHTLRAFQGYWMHAFVGDVTLCLPAR